MTIDCPSDRTLNPTRLLTAPQSLFVLLLEEGTWPCNRCNTFSASSCMVGGFSAVVSRDTIWSIPWSLNACKYSGSVDKKMKD